MKKPLSTLVTIAFVLLLASCRTPQDIAYLQDTDTYKTITPDVSEIRIKPNDKLFILVSCQDPRLTSMFNLPILSRNIAMENSQNNGIAGYTVDYEGNIDFPVVGKINVMGLGRNEVAERIKEELQSRDLVKEPVVTVEYMNFKVAVLGEVLRPGQYEIKNDNLTLLDAIAMAGDLTIFGKRDNVKVLRNEDGIQKTYVVNICSAQQLYNSPAYHLHQNDIVYVEPNATKKRQSTVNGNNIRSTSFWISFASLMTTIAVLVLNNRPR